ncbi:hypothetical protein CL628_02205 [bacterium]|nr:hypothetical protein [bacterium]
MALTAIQLIVNSALLLSLFVLVVIMLRLGARFDFNYGIDEIQGPIKRQMMYLIMAIIIIGLAGAAYNLIVAFI